MPGGGTGWTPQAGWESIGPGQGQLTPQLGPNGIILGYLPSGGQQAQAPGQAPGQVAPGPKPPQKGGSMKGPRGNNFPTGTYGPGNGPPGQTTTEPSPGEKQPQTPEPPPPGGAGSLGAAAGSGANFLKPNLLRAGGAGGTASNYPRFGSYLRQRLGGQGA